MKIDLDNNHLMKIYKKLNPTNISKKRSQNMAYTIDIVIFTAFAKKNDKKIAFENKKEISTVRPLLYFYMKRYAIQ